MVVGLFTQKVCTAKVYATDPIEANRERTWIKLTTKGEIPTNFWAREIPFETKPKPIHFIETGINLLHQKDLQSKLESQDQTLPGYKKAKAKVESLVQLMKKNGIDFENNRNTDPNFQVAAFNIHLSKQTGL
jgi:hypothetical protein